MKTKQLKIENLKLNFNIYRNSFIKMTENEISEIRKTINKYASEMLKITWFLNQTKVCYIMM